MQLWDYSKVMQSSLAYLLYEIDGKLKCEEV